MHITPQISDIRRLRWEDPALSWGLVPTMGALHEGHLSLVRRAREENDRVGVSIFVNPTQFNDPSDLEKYPRTLERDAKLLEAEGVDLIWAPGDDLVYPPGFQTSVIVSQVTKPLEGASRPGHFAGVATIVAKLFNVFEPTRAYFGQKDAQQVAVIRQMVGDLNFNLELVVCPIVRESDGLAMSSRNTLLNPDERRTSTVLYRALTAAVKEWQQGHRDADHLRGTMVHLIQAEPLARIDYVSVADPITLMEIDGAAEHALMSMAVFVGKTRLIDNMIVGDR